MENGGIIDGNGNKNATKEKVLISKAMYCTCVLHFGTFLCHSRCKTTM